MSQEPRLAVLADVHGNRWALEAVLEDLDRLDVERVVNLGDSVYGPLDPGGTARILRELDPPSVRGNQDRLVVDPPERARSTRTYRHVVESLDGDDLEWVRGHVSGPLELGEVLACHGTPERDDEYLVERVTPDGVVLREAGEVAERVGGTDHEVVLCGHSHVPRVVNLPGGRLVVNPGSVGLPAYTDDAPHPHAMEAGSPHARYAMLTRGADGWDVEQVAVAYDWEAAASEAEANGRPDWARWLRTGRG